MTSETYKLEELSNGDLLLKQSKKNICVSLNKINQLTDFDFTNSVITSCIVNNISLDKLKYKPILIIIYNQINDPIKIMCNTKINIKLIEDKDKGYYYITDLGISVQSVDSNKCLFEIINQCIENNILISMKIKLINNSLSAVKLLFNSILT